MSLLSHIKKVVLKQKALKRFIRSLWSSLLWLKYVILFYCAPNSLVAKENAQCIISLTSYPARFDVLHLSIESLFRQSLVADRIILWLAQSQVQDSTLPLALKKLEKRGLEIRYCEDIRSYKKLIYTLQEFPQATIVTVDDDVFYRKNMLKDLRQKQQEYPNEVICDRGLFMQTEGTKAFAPYKTWSYCTKETSSFALFAVGLGGVLYPSGILDKMVQNQQLFHSLCPQADDIWFKTMSLINNKKVHCLGNPFHVTIGRSQQQGLYLTNREKNMNDVQLAQAFNHFDAEYKLYQKLEEA